MTRKHFSLFAAMIAAIPSRARRLEYAEKIIEVCQKTNPRFNEDYFRTAANAELKTELYQAG